MLNKVQLIGNLGTDPETKTTPSGVTVGKLSVATSHRSKVNGEWQDQTEWHRVVVFNQLAETCQKYLTKGRKCYVEGRIQTRQWQADDGTTRYMTEIIGDRVLFLSSKSSDREGSYTQQADDDIPF